MTIPEPPNDGAQQPQQPQQPQYSAPQQPQYAAPSQPQYAPPVQPQYGAPAGGVPGPGEPFDGAADPDDLSRPLYGATFGQAVRRYFRAYAKFDGRASRSEYWWSALFGALVGIVPGILIIIGASIAAAATASGAYIDSSGELQISEVSAGAGAGVGLLFLFLGWGLAIIIGLGLLIPSLAISWRRLHDGNYAGPFYFLTFIPSVGSIILIVLLLMPSRPEGRRFASSVR